MLSMFASDPVVRYVLYKPHCSMRFVVCIPDNPVVFMVMIAMAFNAPIGAAVMFERPE